MCGLAGILALHADAEPPGLDALRAMAGALRHRGPDEFGLYRDRRAGLAHARLSIIDLASGQQPLGNEDGSVQVVFNGEIFNYLELREQLLAAGHRFRTRSDTEVIVHAFEQWGEACFERFNGQFAIGLWLAREERLVLARDRLGVRPLHWCEHAGRLYFASEVKALFAADAAIPRAFDPEGFGETFTFWAPVAPRTVFAGVAEVEPGHLRVVDAAGACERAFWSPRYPSRGAPAFGGGFEDAAGAVRGALQTAVELRMLRADVPVGCYLSGGLDSSLVAALGREVKGERFKTFSMRFEDAEYDETPFQRAMARHLGTDHHEIVVGRAQLAEAFPDAVRHAERPLLRTAPAPLYLLSRAVHDAGIKVVLTGEGADEMFAGYDLFREGAVRRFWARRPGSTARPRLLERLYPYLSRSPVAQQAMARQFFGRDLAEAHLPGFAHQTRWRGTAALKRLFLPHLRAAGETAVARLLCGLPPEFDAWPPLCQDQYLEVRTLLSGYLLSSQGDRMLMAHSVEGRFPFLDREVVALADSLPPEFKLLGLREKRILKRIARDLVPAEIVARTKQPYRAPDALAFTGADRPAWVDDLLSEREVRAAGVFDPSAVAQLWRKCLARGPHGQFSHADNMAVVGVLSTQLLHRQLIRERPAVPSIRLRTLVDRLAARRSA